MLVPSLRLSTMSILVHTFWWTHTPISLDNDFRAELLHVRGGRRLALVHIISLQCICPQSMYEIPSTPHIFPWLF